MFFLFLFFYRKTTVIARTRKTCWHRTPVKRRVHTRVLSQKLECDIVGQGSRYRLYVHDKKKLIEQSIAMTAREGRAFRTLFSKMTQQSQSFLPQNPPTPNETFLNANFAMKLRCWKKFQQLLIATWIWCNRSKFSQDSPTGETKISWGKKDFR